MRLAVMLAAASLLAGVAQAQAPRRTMLTVSDGLGDGQQEETIAVYFGGVLAGTVHVDASHPLDSFTISVPDQDKLGFTMCGKLLRREADGSVTTHPIDNGGVLTGYANAKLEAITLGDVLFTLSDPAAVAESEVQRGPACSAAVA